MDWRSKVELFEQIRREFEFGVGTIAGVAGRAVIVDAGEYSLGHQTLSTSELWQSYVTELLVATK